MVWAYRVLAAYAEGRRSVYETARAELSKIPRSWRSVNVWFSDCFMLPPRRPDGPAHR